MRAGMGENCEFQEWLEKRFGDDQSVSACRRILRSGVGGTGRRQICSGSAAVRRQRQGSCGDTGCDGGRDTLHIAGITYDNQSEEGENSCFQIPISAFDKEIEIVAGTHILGEPHEIPYSLRFYADSIGPENPLPKEAAKRVLAMAALIVIAGGILNHFSKRKRRQDYLGKRS